MSVLQGLCWTPSAFNKQLVAAWKGETNDDRLFYSTYQNGEWAPGATIPGNSSVGPGLAPVGDVVYAAWKGEQDDDVCSILVQRHGLVRPAGYPRE